jgi:hypothetical protein
LNLKRNWLALAASALMFATVASSASCPWWRAELGSGLVTVNADPFFTSFEVLGVSYVIPIIFALNVGLAALFVASGITLAVYAINPEKGYSKHLLSFGWKRPLHVVIGFLVVLALLLYAAPAAVNAMARGLAVPTPIAPLLGSSTIWLPRGLLNIPAQVAIAVTSNFTHSFFLGVAAAVLSIAARAYHRRALRAE